MNKNTFMFSMLVALLAGPLAGSVGAQTVITPIAASSSTPLGGRPISATIDGSGLSAGGTSGDILSETHNNAQGNCWEVATPGAWATFTLPGVSTVDWVYLWNDMYTANRGVTSFDVSFSTDGGSTYPTTFSLSGFTQGSPNAQSRSFAQQSGVTHIKLANLVGNPSYVGFGEIRFGGPIAFSRATVDSITYNSARLKTTLGVQSATASVTAYWWKRGDTVTNSALVGTWGSVAATNISYTIPATPGLSPGTRYDFRFRGTNETAATWSSLGTFLTIFDGEVLAEYTFGGSLASTDSNLGTTAQDMTIAAPGSAVAYTSYLEFNGLGSSYPGGDNFSFVLNTGINNVSLTGIVWDWGVANGYQGKSGFLSDAYQGFGAGAEIPGTYATCGDNVNIAIDSYAADLSALLGFQNLSGASVVFRVSMSDGGSSGRYYRYDNIRVYGKVSAPGVIDISDASVAVSGVLTTQATVSATILNVDGNVTAYWEPGIVANPATFSGWDGTNGPGAEIKVVPFARTLTNLTADTLYTYALFANDGSATDWASGTFITALSAEEAPVFTSASTDSYSVTLNWNDNAAHETGYLLQRSTNGVDYVLRATLASNTVSYIDHALDPTVETFYYRLAATNAAHGGSLTDFTLCETNVVLSLPSIVAAYTFDGNSPASTDSDGSSAASDISLGAGIATSLRNNRIECPAAEVYPLDLAGTDYFEFTLSIPRNYTITLTHVTYTYEEVNSYQPAHALWSDLTGEITVPATRYQPGTTYLNGSRTLVHNLTEAGATFAELTNTNVTFRLYMGDVANSTGEQRFDDVRLYGELLAIPTGGSVFLIR